MKDTWKNTIVTKVYTAVYVAPNTGKSSHRLRPYHGLVLNDANVEREYYFSDGRILKTGGNSLFYLPKGTTYRVRMRSPGGCYAINFDADITDEPFSVRLRSVDRIREHFMEAAEAVQQGNEFWRITATGAVYDAIWQIRREQERRYMASDTVKLLAPAVEEIDRNFTSNELTVEGLARMCNISEVYFRRLFQNSLGVSPKEYIIRKRIGYAKTLLRLEDFSVAEVGRLCGYAEPCHFSREFSRRVGVSPGHYARV